MKKVLVTILAFTYLVVSSGATINLHYCMGKLVNWDFSHQQQSKCDVCGMQKADHKGCCNDKHKVFQIDKDQKTVEFSWQFLPLYTDAVIHHYGDLSAFHATSIAIENPVSHGPPLLSTIPIFLLHCDFRI
jgi:hypothetical protein